MLTLFLVTFLKTFSFFYQKKSVMKIIEKKMATNSPRDAEKLFQNEGHDVYNAFCERRAAPGVLKWEVGGTGTNLWGADETTHSEKSMPKHVGKQRFGNIAQTKSVRKGDFLRGKVSQGRPHPLRHSVKM